MLVLPLGRGLPLNAMTFMACLGQTRIADSITGISQAASNPREDRQEGLVADALSRSLNVVIRCVESNLLTAIQIAFFVPTNTTSFLPLVTAVYSRFRCSIMRSEEHTSELQSRQYLVCR